MAFNGTIPEGLLLRLAMCSQYISKEFKRNSPNDLSFRNGFEKKEIKVTLDANWGKVFKIPVEHIKINNTGSS
ncbi:MAG: hypothetical protein RE472_08650 [Thermoplasmatales archaeon]|nr:MAG: hypothetical protein RE472_08650 [Thermoplasmatales archaeon]